MRPRALVRSAGSVGAVWGDVHVWAFRYGVRVVVRRRDGRWRHVRARYERFPWQQRPHASHLVELDSWLTRETSRGRVRYSKRYLRVKVGL